MEKEIRYGKWDESVGFTLRDGKLYRYCGPGLPWHQRQYVGEGTPSACQAQRQKLLLGTFDLNGYHKVTEDDVLFGIREINHSYWDWTGDIFKDYDIDIIQGKPEDIYKFFQECVIGCDECCGCGDW